MAALVDGVAPDPRDGPGRASRVVVDRGPGELVVVEAVEQAAERPRRERQLLLDRDRVLLVVAVTRDALLAPHRLQLGLVFDEGALDPFALDAEYVTDV